MKIRRVLVASALILLSLGSGYLRAEPVTVEINGFRVEPAPYLDSKLPLEARVRDLVGRMSVAEKAEIMRNESNGVPRLGIPKYDWWNEALHGVARAGEATVFPQAIGLAATWDDQFLHQVAEAISTEARAKHHDAVRKGKRDRYYGLTFWSPNINIFRDPRWGRGQETYGEDPFLTSRMGVAFVRGLQGDDPNFLKTAACAKHFAVHSGPEATRYTANVKPDPVDFHETYLPAFEALVREARVESVMTAYNSVDGYPCAINPTLYGLLREWGFDGHVVSDCGAVYILFEKYGIARDYPEAESLAIKAGLNLRCGWGDPQLEEAFKRGIISQEQLDVGVAPLLRTWFRLGLFDPPERVTYSRIPLSENNSPAHAALAVEAARRSIVLLKNDGVLPLNPKTVRRVALIGPNADSIPALLGNYHGTPTAPVTILAGLRKALGENVAIDYVRGCDYAELRSGRVVVPRTALTHGDFSTDDGNYTGLDGEYFDNVSLAGEPVYRKRAYQIDYHWTDGAPHANVPAGKFSARWTGSLSLSTGDYELVLKARGGVRLFLDGKLVIDAWAPGEKEATVRRPFTAGEVVSVKIEYMSDPESAEVAFLCTAPPADTEFAAAVEKARAADVVIFVGGLYAQLEGEDMRVDFEGFAGGDRTRIELPEIQTRLFHTLAATGKPIIYVNLSGSAVAFPDIAASASAILQAWYPGQAGGTAVADALSGAFNPSGRLPVTFYRGTADLPAFEDYRMENRTYRFFRGQALYPFGHGLSYTRFDYANLKVGDLPNGGMSVSIDVTNTGDRAGGEVVQVYTHEPAEAQRNDKHTLAAFRRLELRAGEKQTLHLEISRTQLRRWDRAASAFGIPEGDWRIDVGASSEDVRASATKRIK